MSFGLLIMVLFVGGGVAMAVVHYSGGALKADDRDPGTAIMEFGRAFPKEAIRSVILTDNGNAAFLRLADGRTGFLQSANKHYVARIIDPAHVLATPLATGNGMNILFRESSLKGGDYVFRTAEDAAEVGVWLVSSFAVAGREPGAPTGQSTSEV